MIPKHFQLFRGEQSVQCVGGALASLVRLQAVSDAFGGFVITEFYKEVGAIVFAGIGIHQQTVETIVDFRLCEIGVALIVESVPLSIVAVIDGTLVLNMMSGEKFVLVAIFTGSEAEPGNNIMCVHL